MWGPWRVGMAASNPEIQIRFQKAGLSMLSPKLGIQLLADVMADGLQLCTPVVAEITWTKLFSADQQVPPLLTEVLTERRLDANKALETERRPLNDIKDIGRMITGIVVGMLGGGVNPDQVNSACKDITYLLCCLSSKQAGKIACMLRRRRAK